MLANQSAHHAILQNMRRCLKMLCFLVTGQYDLKIGNYYLAPKIAENTDAFFGECDTSGKTIFITLTPLALCNDYIFKRTICHEFIHALFIALGKEKAREVIRKLVDKALDLLEGQDPYNNDVWGEEYEQPEEMYCFFLESVLSLLLFVAVEWDVIRDVEYRIYRNFLKGGELNVTQPET